MPTNDTTTILRIKETVAGASPSTNTWIVASAPNAGDHLRVKNNPQLVSNGTDIELEVLSNLASIDVEIRVEVERLG